MTPKAIVCFDEVEASAYGVAKLDDIQFSQQCSRRPERRKEGRQLRIRQGPYHRQDDGKIIPPKGSHNPYPRK